MLLVMTLFKFLALRNSKLSLTTLFSCFCSRIRLTADVRTIAGDHPVLAGAAVSRAVASVLAESMSMLDSRSGERNSPWRPPLVGVYTAVHGAFFEVGQVSFVLCRLRFPTSLKPNSWVAADVGVLGWPAGVIVFSAVFNPCRVTVYLPLRALNMFFPLRTLQKFCLFSSTFLTVDEHCSHSPTEAGVCLVMWRLLNLSLSLTLRPTVCRPVCLGIKHPTGA
jgi:hypothetical protein